MGGFRTDASARKVDKPTAPAAYTQTFSATARTHTDLTSNAVATTPATAVTPFGYSQAQADAITTAINATRVDVDALKKLVNAVIDDLQAALLLG